jgi:hypothetical protein
MFGKNSFTGYFQKAYDIGKTFAKKTAEIVSNPVVSGAISYLAPELAVPLAGLKSSGLLEKLKNIQ